MKKSLIVAMTVLAIGLTGCTTNSKVNEATEKGFSALSAENYDEALESFKLVKEGEENKEKIDNLISIIETYKTAKTNFENKNYLESKKALDSLNQNYINYSIKNNIDNLIKSNTEALSATEKALTDLETIKSFISKDDFNEAEKIYNSINKDYLNEENLSILSDLNTQISNGKKALEEKQKQEDEKKKKESEEKLAKEKKESEEKEKNTQKKTNVTESQAIELVLKLPKFQKYKRKQLDILSSSKTEDGMTGYSIEVYLIREDSMKSDTLGFFFVEKHNGQTYQMNTSTGKFEKTR